MMTSLEVALYQPLIPQNTGNIGRLCVGFEANLHLIEPLGFDIDDKKLKRAGLDYWSHLRWERHKNFSSFHDKNQHKKIVCLSKRADTLIYDYKFKSNSLLLLGQETKGVPNNLLSQYNIERIKLPMLGSIRSYNLANAAAMGLLEFYRQCYHC